MYTSIAQALLAAFEKTPDHTCLIFEEQHYSYATICRHAFDWAAVLNTMDNYQPGDRIALFLNNTPAFVTIYLGTHLAGGTVVLVNTQYRQTELRHILSDAGVRLCVADDEQLVELERVAPDVPDLRTVVLVGPEKRISTDTSATFASTFDVRHYDAYQALSTNVELGSTLALPQPDDIALLAYTSGTTGRSKGAMLTHSNLAANSTAVTEAWRWTEHDRLLLTLPLFHIHGLGVGINGTILARGTVELRRRFDATDVYNTLLRGETSMFFGVPTMYTRLIAEAQQRQEQLPAIRLYVSGSAPLSVQTFTTFEQLFGQHILERYGMSETIMNLTNPYEGERRPGTVGQPFPGQEARIVDVGTRKPILDETQGEIQVRGPHVFKGYWQRPDATAEAFDADGWFNTGDLGWRSADGYYTISGRARELIITGGYNVYPREVEEVLLTHPAVAEAAVLSLPHPDLGEQVVAAIVGAADSRPETENEQQLVEELVAVCREQLASYKKPRQIFFVDALPRNALGKVQKHVLQEQLNTMIMQQARTD